MKKIGGVSLCVLMTVAFLPTNANASINMYSGTGSANPQCVGETIVIIDYSSIGVLPNGVSKYFNKSYTGSVNDVVTVSDLTGAMRDNWPFVYTYNGRNYEIGESFTIPETETGSITITARINSNFLVQGIDFYQEKKKNGTSQDYVVTGSVLAVYDSDKNFLTYIYGWQDDDAYAYLEYTDFISNYFSMINDTVLDATTPPFRGFVNSGEPIETVSISDEGLAQYSITQDNPVVVNYYTEVLKGMHPSYDSLEITGDGGVAKLYAAYATPCAAGATYSDISEFAAACDTNKKGAYCNLEIINNASMEAFGVVRYTNACCSGFHIKPVGE